MMNLAFDRKGLSNLPRLFYLGQPYSNDREFNYGCGLTAVGFLLSQGYHVYAPIVHNHVVAVEHNLSGEFDFWRSFDLTMISKLGALAVLRLPGWEESTGLTAEIEFAASQGIPIYHLPVEITSL